MPATAAVHVLATKGYATHIEQSYCVKMPKLATPWAILRLVSEPNFSMQMSYSYMDYNSYWCGFNYQLNLNTWLCPTQTYEL